MRNTAGCAWAIALTMSFTGCSSSKNGNKPPPDTGLDASPDCVQMQRDYVAGKLAPNPPSDVAGTVHAVLGANDFPQAMPYCSGTRPTGN
jgi:hypothetical protein